MLDLSNSGLANKFIDVSLTITEKVEEDVKTFTYPLHRIKIFSKRARSQVVIIERPISLVIKQTITFP